VRRKRNKFKAWPLVAPTARTPIIAPAADPADPEIVEVAEWLRLSDPTGAITAEVIRDSIDLLLDGQRTGRWCYGHLTKTEKTHLGTIIQIELQKEFDIDDSGPLDYAIAGIPVDCKYSTEYGKWQLPREMYRRNENGAEVGEDHIALLVWAEELSRNWLAGLVRITESRLGTGKNQDKKRTLRPEALKEIHRIWDDPPPLPENTLLELPQADRDAIFAFDRSGQARINELFRRVQLKTIRRSVILTVAQQDDALKRPRDARKHLQPEGIVVFGHEGEHHRIAEALGIPAIPTVDRLPDKGEFLGARLAPSPVAPSPGVATIDGADWRLAEPEDPPSHGPKLPRSASTD
jgi:hypothetical protein